MKKWYFSVIYREFYDAVDKSLFPVCCAWIYNDKVVYPYTISCNAVDEIIRALSFTDREMIIRAFARNMVGEFLYKSEQTISGIMRSIVDKSDPALNVRDFLKDTRYIFDALSERQVEILRDIIKVWNEYDQKRGENK